MKILFIIFLLPLQLFAQDITGAWTGTLYNDTTKQFLKYELAISEYNGKLSGYSYTIFIIDGIENVGVKSIKIKKSGKEYLLEDNKLIYNNYSEPPAKGVRTFSKLILFQTDSTMILRGPWKTNTTKVYSTITGNIFLQKKKEINQTLIIPKLENLGLASSLSFMPIQTTSTDLTISDKPVLKINEQEKQKENITKVDSQPGKPIKPEQASTFNVKKNKKNPEEDLKKNNEIKGDKEVQLAAKNFNKQNTQATNASLAKTESAKTSTPFIEKQSNDIKETPVVISKNNSSETLKTEVKQVPKAAAEIASRKIETLRSVEIKNDSLVLTLYDNGEIDGDTVSVLLNGKIIMPLQGLTAKGINKTIYLTPEMGDSLTLIMYAENLGNIPPNTGLLVVHDGDDNYEIRFSGDLKKNSAIILKRRHKQ
jgi:hypothetical protein